MATNTPNYGLTKPAQDDFYDVDVFNGNADIIDAEVKKTYDLASQAVPVSEKGVAGGVATLGTDGKVPLLQLPSMNYDPAGSAETVQANLNTHAGDASVHITAAERAAWNASALTFAYKCTGSSDSTAIANIVNDFYNSGTAMSMKLIVTGTMGVAFKSAGSLYCAMVLNASNSRGATCFLDFTDCFIPEITTASRNFLYVDSADIRLCCIGLNVTTAAHGVYLMNANNNTFRDCVINVAGYGFVSTNGGGHTLDNCTITSTITGTNTIGAINFGDSSADRSLFLGCTINSIGTHAIRIAYRIDFLGCTINSTNGYGVYHAQDCKFSSCAITSSDIGVSIPSGISGTSVFTNCKIIGATTGIQAASSNTTLTVKLTDCEIKGTSTADINQATAASTMAWNIKGCSFSRASIYVNGATMSVSSATANAYLYMPAYANLFSRTIT